MVIGYNTEIIIGISLLDRTEILVHPCFLWAVIYSPLTTFIIVFIFNLFIRNSISKFAHRQEF